MELDSMEEAQLCPARCWKSLSATKVSFPQADGEASLCRSPCVRCSIPPRVKPLSSVAYSPPPRLSALRVDMLPRHHCCGPAAVHRATGTADPNTTDLISLQMSALGGGAAARSVPAALPSRDPLRFSPEEGIWLGGCSPRRCEREEWRSDVSTHTGVEAASREAWGAARRGEKNEGGNQIRSRLGLRVDSR